MAQLETILGKMDRINRDMRATIHRAGPALTQQIVDLRQEFSTETGNLIHELPGDERLRYRPALFGEFQDRLDNVRQRLANHQSRWSILDIKRHREDYLAASESVHHSIAEYVDWAKEQLDQD